MVLVVTVVAAVIVVALLAKTKSREAAREVEVVVLRKQRHRL